MSKYSWLAVGPYIGATVNAPVARIAAEYRYHVTLDFGLMTESFRARVLSALKDGFTPLDEVRKFLNVFQKPYGFVCGYIGKSQAHFPLPALSMEEAASFKTRVKASCVMAGLEKGVLASLTTVDGTLCVGVKVILSGYAVGAIILEKKGDQLRNRLDFLKGIAREIGSETFPQRERFYNMVLNREKIECDLVGNGQEKRRTA